MYETVFRDTWNLIADSKIRLISLPQPFGMVLLKVNRTVIARNKMNGMEWLKKVHMLVYPLLVQMSSFHRQLNYMQVPVLTIIFGLKPQTS